MPDNLMNDCYTVSLKNGRHILTNLQTRVDNKGNLIIITLITDNIVVVPVSELKAITPWRKFGEGIED